MSPLGVPFIDDHAQRGGTHYTDSRTITVKDRKKIRFYFDSKKGKFLLSIPEYGMISITKLNASNLVEWILSFTGASSDIRSHKKKALGRKSKSCT